MTKSKRFWLSMLVILFMMIATIYSISQKMETTSVTALGSIMTIGGIYLWAETKRKSDG